ncbi:MAG: hypothetical protein ACFFEV_02625, partial [Candidatus Thorarchaeota archaeon]
VRLWCVELERETQIADYVVVCHPTTLGRDMEIYDGKTRALVGVVQKSGFYTYHINDKSGERLFSATGSHKRGCLIIDTFGNQLAKLSQKVLSRKFELEYNKEVYVPHAIDTKRGFLASSVSGLPGWNLKKQSEGRKAVWYIELQQPMDWRVAVGSSIFIGTQFWEELSRGRQALCWGCGEGCGDPCLCCILFIVIILILATQFNLLGWFIGLLDFFGI